MNEHWADPESRILISRRFSLSFPPLTTSSDETLEALSDAQVVAPAALTVDLHSADHRNSFLYVFDYQTKFGDYPQVTESATQREKFSLCLLIFRYLLMMLFLGWAWVWEEESQRNKYQPKSVVTGCMRALEGEKKSNFELLKSSNLWPRWKLLERKLSTRTSSTGNFFQSMKHTSEHHKYDEFMCIMYEAITREKKPDESYANRSKREGWVSRMCNKPSETPSRRLSCLHIICGAIGITWEKSVFHLFSIKQTEMSSELFQGILAFRSDSLLQNWQKVGRWRHRNSWICGWRDFDDFKWKNLKTSSVCRQSYIVLPCTKLSYKPQFLTWKTSKVMQLRSESKVELKVNSEFFLFDLVNSSFFRWNSPAELQSNLSRFTPALRS